MAGELALPPGWLNETLLAFHGLERAWLRLGSLPFGVGVLILARRPVGERVRS